jgi:hypothetical protein
MLAAIVVDRVRDAWTERRLAHTKRRMACSFNRQQKNEQKTYNSGYSLVVTHLTTNPPVRCLNRAERTGSLVFNVLWSYVLGVHVFLFIILLQPVHRFT